MILKQSTNYYYLVAGLPDLQKDDTKGILPLEELLSEIKSQVSKEDANRIFLLFAHYDNQNLLAYLADKEADLHPKAVLTRMDWEELVHLMREDENPKDSRLLPYMVDFYQLTQTEEDFLKGISAEDYLAGLYYHYGLQSDNKFMHDWFEFNLNLNNLLTAINCRKYAISPEKLIVGENDISKVLRTSHARDFGIGNLFDYTDDVIKLMEENDLLERERKIDALKWDWLEENSFFHYFSIERIMAHLLKVEMLERWKFLSIEEGSKIFRELLASMKPEKL